MQNKIMQMVIVGGDMDGLQGTPVQRIEEEAGVTDCQMDTEGPHAVATLFVSGIGLVQVPSERLCPIA